LAKYRTLGGDVRVVSVEKCIWHLTFDIAYPNLNLRSRFYLVHELF